MKPNISTTLLRVNIPIESICVVKKPVIKNIKSCKLSCNKNAFKCTCVYLQ